MSNRKPDMLRDEEKREFELEGGGHLWLEYRHDNSSDDYKHRRRSFTPVQELRAKLDKILPYFGEIGALERFARRLGVPWKELKGRDKCVALLQRYAWPDDEEAGLNELLDEAQRFLTDLGVRQERQRQ